MFGPAGFMQAPIAIEKVKNNCKNCAHHRVAIGCDSDGYENWDEHHCLKRPDEVEERIEDPTYRNRPKRCFEATQLTD